MSVLVIQSFSGQIVVLFSQCLPTGISDSTMEFLFFLLDIGRCSPLSRIHQECSVMIQRGRVRGGKGSHERGVVCVLMADSRCCMAETKRTL